MADYKTIHGTKVRTYTTNPDNPIEGQVWYNDTDNVLKFQFPNRTSSWRTGNDMNTSRGGHLAGIGTQTACIGVGGENPGGYQAINEQYDGTSWTEVGDLSTGRANLAGAGASSVSYTHLRAHET